MTQSDDLWVEGQGDDLISQSPHCRPRSATDSRHIGCPLSWFRLVLPIVRGKNELAVALFIYRQRAVRKSRTVVISNAELSELGIDRYAKYRALKRLAAAGILTVNHHNKRALKIIFHHQRPRRRGEGNEPPEKLWHART